MAIIHPLKPRISATKVFAIIAGIWVASIGVAMPNLIVGSTYQKGDATICFPDWPGGPIGTADFM